MTQSPLIDRLEKFQAKPISGAQRELWAQGFSLLETAMFVWKSGAFEWEHIEQAARIFSSHADQLPHHPDTLQARISPAGRKARKSALRALTWDGARYKISYEFTRFDGQIVWLEEAGLRVSGDGKTPEHIVGVIRDIQSYKQAEQMAAYNARHDGLTGLWNAARMEEALFHVIASCQRYEQSACLIGVQLLNLGDVNATYGYDAGDRLIAGVAARLKSHIRVPDLVARIDGDVLAICLSHSTISDAEILAGRLKDILAGTSYQTPFGDLYLDLGFGAAQIPKQASMPHQSIEFMQSALAASKARQGAFVPYTAALSPQPKPRRPSDFTQNDILEALNSRRITLAYQPVVHASTRDLHHYECLLRLRREDGEIVPAGEFIMAAERLELVHLLDRRALEIASETLRLVDGVKLALNISAATAKNVAAAQDYIATLKTLGAQTKRVIIELTETVAIDDPAMASQFSSAVRALGATFAIDDFGAGYTTFQNLMAIEADEIKIDGSFIRDLSVTPHKQVFVRMMVDLAQTFSVKTVAEFVETREDADLLTRLGVDYLQGYLFGVPSTSPDWSGASKTKTLTAAE